MINATLMARLTGLSRWAKTGAVIGGYIAAFALALVAVTLHILLTSGPDRDLSSGMHAFGDALVFTAAFGVTAALPTALALHFVRTSRPFWWLLSRVALALSVTGVAASVFVADAGVDVSESIWRVIAVLRVLIAPLVAAFLVLCGLLSPDRRSRILLIGAACGECVTSMFAIAHWVLPLLLPGGS